MERIQFYKDNKKIEVEISKNNFTNNDILDIISFLSGVEEVNDIKNVTIKIEKK